MNKTDVAIRLAKKGIPATDIANVLEMDLDNVVSLGITREVGQTSLDNVSEAMEGIVWLVYDEAKRTMTVGSPAQKNFLMRLVIGYLMRTMAVQTPHALIDLQEEFRELMERQGQPDPDEVAETLDEAWVEDDDPPEDD